MNKKNSYTIGQSIYSNQLSRLRFLCLILLTFFISLVLSTTVTAQEEQANNAVSGQVTDSSTGETLPGVNVVLMGTNRGTTTDANGRYEITVPSLQDTLLFSFIGFQNREVPINGRTEINIILQSEIIAGEEVLVVGYGEQQSKITATGAGSSITGASIDQIPSPNVTESLSGKIPGLVMYNSSGQPGDDEPTIRIRGEHTLNNNSPLIVIDGVPNRSGGMSRLNPDDIENITVLKDATAAIYGAQAGNGVILIETKRGRSGAPQFDFSYNQGIAMPTLYPDMADAPTYLRMMNEVNLYNGNPELYPEEEIRKYENIEEQDPWLYHDTDWTKEAIQDYALRYNANFSVAGGSEDITYRLSFGSKTENGVLVNSDNKYSQYNFRSNIDASLSEYVDLRFSASGRWEDRNYAPKHGAFTDVSTFTIISLMKPHMPAFWPNGRPGPAIEEGENPVIMGSDVTGLEEDDRYYLQTGLQMHLDVPNIEGLSIRATGTFDKTDRDLKRWYTPWTLYSFDDDIYRQEGGDPEQYLQGAKRGPNTPELTQRSSSQHDFLVNLVGEYQKDLENHSFGILAGSEYQNSNDFYFQAFRTGFLSDLTSQFFAGSQDNQDIAGSADSGSRLNFFSRINYDYQNKYLFEVVGRYDGSYIFPEGNRFGFFPALSVGWRLTEENFFRNNVGLFDEFKVRASWGKTGNDRVGPYQFLTTYSYGRGYYFNPGGKAQSIYPSGTPNPNITWEVANQFDVGLEAAILDNRLSFEIDYFDYLRTNILTFRNASVPRTTGLDLPRENIGEVESWGFDGSITWEQTVNEDFIYDVTLNAGYSTNKIRYWDEPSGAPAWQRSTGSKMNTALRYDVIGVFRDQEEVDNYPSWPGARPGDLIFRDVDGDEEITSDDRVRADRNSVPELTGGLTISSSYKQFQATIFFQGAAGASEYAVTEGGDRGNYFAEFANNRWRPDPNDPTGMTPHPDYEEFEEPRAYNRNQEYWKENGNTHFWRKTDYIRLRQVELAYNLKPQTLNKVGLNSARIYVNGFNLATWTDFVGDPATANEISSYPPLKVFNVGLNINL